MIETINWEALSGNGSLTHCGGSNIWCNEQTGVHWSDKKFWYNVVTRVKSDDSHY